MGERPIGLLQFWPKKKIAKVVRGLHKWYVHVTSLQRRKKPKNRGPFSEKVNRRQERSQQTCHSFTCFAGRDELIRRQVATKPLRSEWLFECFWGAGVLRSALA